MHFGRVRGHGIQLLLAQEVQAEAPRVRASRVECE